MSWACLKDCPLHSSSMLSIGPKFNPASLVVELTRIFFSSTINCYYTIGEHKNIQLFMNFREDLHFNSRTLVHIVRYIFYIF